MSGLDNVRPLSDDAINAFLDRRSRYSDVAAVAAALARLKFVGSADDSAAYKGALRRRKAKEYRDWLMVQGHTHVPGGCQLFRRRCFEDIGGYVADEFFVRNGAAGASPACTSAGCDCRDRPDGAPCDDGNACTVDDACLGGACGGMPQGCHGGGCTGSPLACDDGDACTEDACDPAAGCRHTPIDLPAVKRALVRPEAVGACAAGTPGSSRTRSRTGSGPWRTAASWT